MKPRLPWMSSTVEACGVTWHRYSTSTPQPCDRCGMRANVRYEQLEGDRLTWCRDCITCALHIEAEGAPHA